MGAFFSASIDENRAKADKKVKDAYYTTNTYSNSLLFAQTGAMYSSWIKIMLRKNLKAKTTKNKKIWITQLFYVVTELKKEN